MFRKSARKREEPSLRRSVVGLLRSNLSKVERIQYSPSTTPDSTPFYGPRRRIRIHSMSALSRNVLSRRAGLAVNPTASPAFSYGRTAAYRRLSQVQNGSVSRESSLLTTLSAPSALRSQFLPATISSSSRTFSSFAPYLQQQKQPEDVKDPPRPEQKASSEEPGSEEKAKEAEGEEKAEGEGEGPKEKKKAAPPPPKHGDKTPWQVFRDTLQQEFKASKEWNEGTKELQGSLHDFTQNPNVQKAKSAYTKATDAATSTTTAALKTTAGAIGSGAAWTWDTSVMKGVRKGARVVGTGLDKATKPLRETEAYKDVKNVIDDGSSMRYGGWVEKEERRKRREQKEAEEALKSGRPRSTEPMEEDPKYVADLRQTCIMPPVHDLLTSFQRRNKHHTPQGREMERILARVPRLLQADATSIRHEVCLQRVRKPSHLHRPLHLRPRRRLFRRERDCRGDQEVP